MLISSSDIYIRSPVSLVISATFFCGFLWLIAPIDFIFEGQAIAVAVGFSLLLLFIFGLFFGFGRIKTPSVCLVFDVIKVRRVVAALFFLGFLGFILRSVERIYIRGGGHLTTDFIANREIINSTEGVGTISLIGGILSTLLFFLPFYVFLLRKLGDRNWRYFFVFLLTILYPIADVLIQGSRSTLVIYLATCILSFTLLHRVNLRYIIGGSLFLGALVWGAARVFVIRTEQMGIDPVASMYLSGYSYFAPASQSVIDYLSHGGIDGIGSAIYAFVHLCQYLLHGLYEFFYVANNIERPTTFGLQAFYIPVKIFTSLFGGQDVEPIISAGLLRSGVYNTLFGPWLYDFGVFGALLVSLIFGFGAGSFGRLILKGKFAFMPVYLFVVSLLPFLLVVNLFVSGTGQYALFSVAFLMVMFSLRYFRCCIGQRRRVL